MWGALAGERMGLLPRSKSKLCYDRRLVGQSILVTSPIWGPRPCICYCQAVADLLIWEALSDERMGLWFTIATGPRQPPSHGGLMTIFYGLRFETPPTWSESDSELLYDWRFTANQFVLATSPLRLATTNFIFQLNTCVIVLM
jgi:hypothetical protein